MIPLRDTIPARRFPVVNAVLIGLNVFVFLIEATLGPEAQEEFIWTWGLIPARFWQGISLGGWLPLVTSMFMHGGWWHLISNMLALYIFGDNVEDRLGSIRYLLFYLAGGLAAGAAHLLAQARSPIPMVGASGAIACVLGAYLVLYPHARVVTLVPMFYFVRLVELPALLYLGIWFVSQLFNGLFSLTAVSLYQAGGVAWWAHIGGFVFGVGLIRLVAPRQEIVYRGYLHERYPWRDDDPWWPGRG